MSWNDGKLFYACLIAVISGYQGLPVSNFLARMKPIYRSALILTVLIILLNLLLLLYGYVSGGSDLVFGGLLYNTIDGQSYLVKIKEGFNGEWRFTLAYSCEKGEGAYVLLYYIFLGHLARWLGVSIPFIFHFARLVNAGILVFAIAHLITKVIPDERWADRALWLTCLGSSMGYIALLFGTLSDNVTLAEGYPFLSIFGNPHFSLGTAIFVAIIICLMEQDTWRRALIAGGLALLLAVVQPIQVVIIVAVTGLFAAWKLFQEHRLDYRVPLLVVLGGGVYLTYQYWILTTDPILSQWNAQNITPSSTWWDLILCLSPAIFYCILAVLRRNYLAFRPHPVIIIWLITSIVLTYAPLALQRRFMAGIYIPLVILAFLGVTTFLGQQCLTRWLHNILWILSLPGTVIFLLLPLYGISTLNNAFFLTRGEVDALRWLNDTANPNSLVLASPSMGLFIPTYTQDCVFYGHPFETLNGDANEQLVKNLYNGVFATPDANDYLINKGVDYVFFGPRERMLGSPEFPLDLPVAYSNDDVIIYEYPQE
jgi:hypothetical protein